MAKGLVGMSVWACCHGAWARPWTNDQGRTIEADYVSSDGTSVVLNFNGKQVTYELARLSATDREFASAQLKGAATPQAVRTGWIRDFPISKPAFADTKGYLEGHNAKAVYKAFDSGDFPDSWGDRNKKDAANEFAYENGSTIVYVPASYTGTEPYGVYVHISPGDGGENLTDYGPVMDRLKLIYVSPRGTSNNQPMLRRVKLAVDALATVRRHGKPTPSAPWSAASLAVATWPCSPTPCFQRCSSPP